MKIELNADAIPEDFDRGAFMMRGALGLAVSVVLC